MKHILACNAEYGPVVRISDDPVLIGRLVNDFGRVVRDRHAP